MFEYQLKDNKYALYDTKENEIISMNSQISILFDKQDFVLLKYGNPELVKQTFDLMKQRYIEANLLDFANDLSIISGNIDIDELNKIINCTGYLKVFLKKSENLMKEEKSDRKSVN